MEKAGEVVAEAIYQRSISLRIWDVAGKCLLNNVSRVGEFHGDRIMGVALSGDGDRVISSSSDSIHVWNPADGSKLYSFTVRNSRGVTFGKDNKHILFSLDRDNLLDVDDRQFAMYAKPRDPFGVRIISLPN